MDENPSDCQRRLCLKSLLVASFVTVAMLASTGTGWAQGIGGGVKLGANFATVNGDVIGEKSPRVGLVFGAFLTVPKAPIAFQPEVLYSMQGVKFEEDDGTEFTAAIDEVQIPLLLRIGASSGGGYLLFGPSIGFVTSAKIKVSDEEDEEDFKDELKSTDIGIVVG